MEIIPIKVSASSEGKHENKIRRAKCVLDKNDLTFWFTDKQPQFLQFSFSEATSINSVEITFQGGFASESVQFYGSRDGTTFEPIGNPQFVDNVNTAQMFPISAEDVVSLKAEFEGSFDLYNRLIIYSTRFFK